MNELYIEYPYKKINKQKINNIIEKNGTTYKSPKETIIFLGNDKIQADIFKINSKECDYILENGEIFYKTDDNFIEESINYGHRLDIMQENLANAIVRLCIKKLTNLKVNNYYIDDKTNKIIIDNADISYKNINEIEDLASYICFANLRIENEKDTISIDGYGSISHDGPCLERSGELGLIKIKEVNKNQDNQVEIEIVAGKRALFDYNEKSKIINNIKNILFINDDEEIFKEIKKLKSKVNTNHEDKQNKTNNLENSSEAKTGNEPKNTREINTENKEKTDNQNTKATNQNKQNLKTKNSKSNINYEETINSFKNLSTLVGDKKYIYKIIKNMSLEDIKKISNKIMKEKNYIQIYGIENFDESQIVVTRSQNINIDLKEISNNISKKIPIKGYGNIYQVIVNVATKNLASAMEAFLINIKNQSENK